MKMPEPQERILSQLTSPFRLVPDMATCSTRQGLPSFAYDSNVKIFGEEHPHLQQPTVDLKDIPPIPNLFKGGYIKK